MEDGSPVVVMERIAGEPLGSAPLTEAQTHALGRTLRRVYDVPLGAARAAGIVERRYGPSTHRHTIAAWLNEPHSLDDCRDPELVASAVDAAIGWLATPDHQPPPRLTALGIADLNPANVLWDGRTCRLVDFEDGELADPAYQLHRAHVEHLAGRFPPVYDPAALIGAVGLSAQDQDRVKSYRPLWAAFWLAMLLPGNGGFRRNPPGTTETQARHLMAMLD